MDDYRCLPHTIASSVLNYTVRIKLLKKTNHAFDEFSSLVILTPVCHKKKNVESPTSPLKKISSTTKFKDTEHELHLRTLSTFGISVFHTGVHGSRVVYQ